MLRIFQIVACWRGPRAVKFILLAVQELRTGIQIQLEDEEQSDLRDGAVA